MNTSYRHAQPESDFDSRADGNPDDFRSTILPEPQPTLADKRRINRDHAIDAGPGGGYVDPEKDGPAHTRTSTDSGCDLRRIEFVAKITATCRQSSSGNDHPREL